MANVNIKGLDKAEVLLAFGEYRDKGSLHEPLQKGVEK